MGVKMEKNVIIVLLLVLLVYYLSGQKKERPTFSQDNIVIYRSWPWWTRWWGKF